MVEHKTAQNCSCSSLPGRLQRRATVKVKIDFYVKRYRITL